MLRLKSGSQMGCLGELYMRETGLTKASCLELLSPSKRTRNSIFPNFFRAFALSNVGIVEAVPHWKIGPQ